MISEYMQQGTPEWHQARVGIPTASNMSKIVTSTGKKSATYFPYLYKLVAERITGTKEDTFTSDWMLRGIELEPQAKAVYRLYHDLTTLDEPGFCYLDDKKACGFSPDAIVTPLKSGLEIKCPSPAVHIEYHVRNELPTDYKPQLWASLYMSGLDQWVFMSYHPEMPPFFKTVSITDTDYLTYADALQKYLPQFISDLNTIYTDVALRFGMQPTFTRG